MRRSWRLPRSAGLGGAASPSHRPAPRAPAAPLSGGARCGSEVRLVARRALTPAGACGPKGLVWVSRCGRTGSWLAEEATVARCRFAGVDEDVLAVRQVDERGPALRHVVEVDPELGGAV